MVINVIKKKNTYETNHNYYATDANRYWHAGTKANIVYQGRWSVVSDL